MPDGFEIPPELLTPPIDVCIPVLPVRGAELTIVIVAPLLGAAVVEPEGFALLSEPELEEPNRLDITLVTPLATDDVADD